MVLRVLHRDVERHHPARPSRRWRKKVGRRRGASRRSRSRWAPTINMDGTSIMQGVAVVFAAQAVRHRSWRRRITPTVIATATLASIGTAGVPSVGLMTLAMVFDSVGLPVAGIGLIMGIDRILDMRAHGGEHHGRRGRAPRSWPSAPGRHGHRRVQRPRRRPRTGRREVLHSRRFAVQLSLPRMRNRPASIGGGAIFYDF